MGKSVRDTLLDLIGDFAVFGSRLNWSILDDGGLVRLLVEASRYDPQELSSEDGPILSVGHGFISRLPSKQDSVPKGARTLLNQGLVEAGRRGLLPADEDTFRVEVDQALAAGTLQIETDPPHTLVSLWAASRWPELLEDKWTLGAAVKWLRSAFHMVSPGSTLYVNGHEYAVPATTSAEIIAEELAEQFRAGGAPLEVRVHDGQVVLTAAPGSAVAVWSRGSDADGGASHRRSIGTNLARRLGGRSRR